MIPSRAFLFLTDPHLLFFPTLLSLLPRFLQSRRRPFAGQFRFLGRWTGPWRSFLPWFGRCRVFVDFVLAFVAVVAFDVLGLAVVEGVLFVGAAAVGELGAAEDVGGASVPWVKGIDCLEEGWYMISEVLSGGGESDPWVTGGGGGGAHILHSF